MWNLHRLAKEYGQRPSVMFGLDDEWTAWDFDHAVYFFVQHVEGELAACKTDAARQRKLRRLLGIASKPLNVSALQQVRGIQVQRG